MTVPNQYQRAADDFFKFLVDARNEAGLGSTHQSYTMVQGVLQAFRRRLDVKDAIRFAGVLPAMVRAMFVSDWDTDEPKRPFESREAMTREVQALRGDHNISPDSSIRDVAVALRKNLADQPAFDQILATLPAGAAEFWQPSRT